MEKNFLDIFLHGQGQRQENIIKTLNIRDIDGHKRGIVNILSSLIEKKFIIDDNNRIVINTLFNYFIGNDIFCIEHDIDLNKGILLCGGVGTGKSVLFRALKIYTAEILRENSFQTFQASEIIDSVNVNGIEPLEKFGENLSNGQPRPITCYVDDIASKNEKIKNYGTEISVIEQLISIRYNIYQKYRKLSHFSTNIYPAELSKIYDLRIIDRLKEMCNIIELAGPSRRK